ncbi:hypothetical protein Tco_1193585 [Tanacetum coccineum]
MNLRCDDNQYSSAQISLDPYLTIVFATLCPLKKIFTHSSSMGEEGATLFAGFISLWPEGANEDALRENGASGLGCGINIRGGFVVDVEGHRWVLVGAVEGDVGLRRWMKSRAKAAVFDIRQGAKTIPATEAAPGDAGTPAAQPGHGAGAGGHGAGGDAVGWDAGCPPVVWGGAASGVLALWGGWGWRLTGRAREVTGERLVVGVEWGVESDWSSGGGFFGVCGLGGACAMALALDLCVCYACCLGAMCAAYSSDVPCEVSGRSPFILPRLLHSAETAAWERMVATLILVAARCGLMWGYVLVAFVLWIVLLLTFAGSIVCSVLDFCSPSALYT